MNRYFLELAYKGTRYSGFQAQPNALTVQAEVEKALETFFRVKFILTGSSRTDAGVHALQNFFHFDTELEIPAVSLYNVNAILPRDIVVKSIRLVKGPAGNEAPHSRFSAKYREYKYYIYQSKDPFLDDRAYYYPYTLNIEAMQEAAAVVPGYHDFTSFSKRNTQVKTFQCTIMESRWVQEGDCIVYNVKANRFLRGMVRALVGTMLQVGRGKIAVGEFRGIIEKKDCTLADFSAPGHGLFLAGVGYEENIFR
jgi:tRNA pseudouridine38-40 synthase